MIDLKTLAGWLGPLRPDPQARMFYDLFAGGLVWSDEAPLGATDATGEPIAWSVRGLWHYRSSLILGEPAERLRSSWEEAQRCFPGWPGFLPERRDPALAEECRQRAAAALASWEEWDAHFERQRQQQSSNANA